MDESFIRTVEMDYAVQYLSKMGMNPTQANVSDLLKKFPLSSCEIQTSGWDNTRDTVDTITIYPHRHKKMTFEKKYNKMKSESKKPKGHKASHDLTEEEVLAQEKKKYMEVSGLAALQEKEKQRLKEPAPKKNEMEEEVTKRLNQLPKFQETAGQLTLKALRMESKQNAESEVWDMIFNA